MKRKISNEVKPKATRDGALIVKCPFCKFKQSVGAYGAAQLGSGNDLEGPCQNPKCRQQLVVLNTLHSEEE